MEDIEKELYVFYESLDQRTNGGLNTWFIDKAAKTERMKVVISCLGSDEMFGSYATFKHVPSIVNNSNYYVIQTG